MKDCIIDDKKKCSVGRSGVTRDINETISKKKKKTLVYNIFFLMFSFLELRVR